MRAGKGAFSLLAAASPVLVFGGCYSNLEATQALRAKAARLGIRPEHTICTGDVVAYCADARETVALIRDWGIHVVKGNCEESLGSQKDDCGCGFADGTACDQLSAAWYAHANAEITDEQREWMRTLPRRIDLLLGGRRVAVVHGSVDSINRFVFASTPWSEKERQIALAACDGVIGGHCGIPFTHAVEGKLWHNAGAIGIPANDGTPRGWYSLLIPTDGGIQIRTEALDYDAPSAAAKVRRRGLPEGYAAALETGLWPSCDVLPAAELRVRGRAIPAGATIWNGASASWPAMVVEAHPAGVKFGDPEITLSRERRASVQLKTLETLWFNTGTLCNLACENCYIESTPKNDRLVYLTRAEVRRFLAEAAGRDPRPVEIGFTGGEPFMNPDILGMIEDSLAGGFTVLVLTNAMRPMQRHLKPLRDLNRRFPGQLALRVSLDHYDQEGHEQLRGSFTWEKTIEGLLWLAGNGFDLSVAGRTVWREPEAATRAGYRALFTELGVAIDAEDPLRLVLFPEMTANDDVPEITEQCWGTLGKSPEAVMCANSRMVVKRKGADQPCVVSCTLLPYDSAFELGATLADAARPVKLNHRYCAQFCVLGGASCSAHR
ncbi:radical SAM protein [Enhydrobacter aerosaccus]|nr:radical SAM protein [Enhydrobacter aerosaccus]